MVNFAKARATIADHRSPCRNARPSLMQLFQPPNGSCGQPEQLWVIRDVAGEGIGSTRHELTIQRQSDDGERDNETSLAAPRRDKKTEE